MNKLNSFLGAAAVIAIAVVFIVQFRPNSGAQKTDSGPKCAAEVRGTCIDTNFFWASYYLLTSRGVDANKLRAMGFRKQVVDGLIETALLNQDAKRLGVTVSEDDVSGEIFAGRAHVSLPADKAANLGYNLGLARRPGDDLVAQLFVKERKSKKADAKTAEKEIRRRTRLSPAEFREFQRQELVAARMRELIKSRVRISENEAFEEFSRLKSTAQIDFVRFDRGFYADFAVDTSAKAVDEWADKHKDEIDKAWEARKSQIMPECRLTRHILIKVPETATDEEKAEKKKRILHALDRVNKGEDFGDVARAMSEDTSSVRGGDLGCVPKGMMVKPFEDATFALAEGKVSDVVESQFGYHIIKVDKIAKDAEAEKLGKHYIALDHYAGYESDRIATEGAKAIIAAVRNGKSLEDALKAHLDQVIIKRADKKSDKKADKKADDKKADKKADDKKADDKKADEDKPLTAENDPRRPVVETSMSFTPAGGEPIPDLAPGADLMKDVFALDKPGTISDDVLPLRNGHAIFQLKAKTAATREQFDKDKDYYIDSIRAAKQNDALIGYVKRLQSVLASDVVYKKEVVEEPKPKAGEDEQPQQAPESDDPGE